MPLGSIILILKKQSSLGHIDNLYESIENLDESCFNTEACKKMLLNPLNTFPYFSLVPKSKCGCGETMDFAWFWEKKEHKKGPNGDGVFVRKNVTFIITDDLCVIPASTTTMHTVIQKLGIEALDNTEETCFDLDVKLLQDLLRRSLTSKSAITDIYFRKTDIVEQTLFYSKFRKVEEDVYLGKDSKKVKAKLIICKYTNKVLFIEAEEGFVDLVFSFLSLPLGSIVKLLSKFSSVGCMGNLYKSVEDMSSSTKYLKPDKLELLLDPKLAAHFSPEK